MKNAKPTIEPSAVGAILSAAQADAACRDARAIVVSAAAGSGKTRVLVERFARAVVERGIAPERIIAITYTQKAADELRERIEKRLEAAGRGLLGGREPSIGTIHGFCLRLLEENAIDAGLDPSFRVLQGDLYYSVLEEAADETLDEAIRAQGEAYRPLFDYAEPGALRSALITAYERSRTLGQRAIPYPPPDLKELRGRVNRWIKDIAEWRLGLPDKLADRLADIPKIDLSWEAWLETLPALLPAIKQNGRTRAHAEYAQGFADELESLIAAVADAVAAPYNARFAELLGRITAAVESRKRSGSWVDLHDLMDRVIALLERPAFCARIKEDYTALFIDEYQDVNALQAKLLDRLGADLEVFTVGDARQAIYGFRYAESEFFIKRLEQAQERKNAVQIPENYRSRRETVNWINRLFTDGGTGGVFGALQACRVEDGAAAASPSPRVRLLWTVPEEGKRNLADDQRASDAEHAAQEIARMIASGEERAGGIAILLRGMTALPAYEEALRRHRIPYHVMRGKGFYEKSEIVDLLNLFRTLQNPDEPLFAAALLRSPFAGIGDDDIWRIFKNHGGSASESEGNEAPTLASRIKSAIGDERSAAARSALKGFWEWFAPLAEIRQELTLTQILEQALQHSVFEAMTLAQEDGTRRYANIRKFKDALREFESLYGSNLDAFVAQLESRMDWMSDDEETEAPVAAERGNAVRIMTVHASKGLEFDTVVIGDVSNTAPKSRREGVFMVDDEGRVVSCPLAADEEGGRVDAASFLEYQARRARKDSEESLRLLYVAATRARERLVLCGSLPAKEKKEGTARSWTDVVLEAFPESAEQLGCLGEGECRYEVKRRLINAPLMRIDAEGESAGCADAAASSSTRVVANGADTVCDEAVQKILAGLEDRSKPYRQTVDITVSELAGSDEDEDGLGLPGIVFDSGGPEAEASLLAAASVGHVFHEMLQHIAYDREPAEEQARILRDFSHRMDAAAERSFEPALAAFMNSALAADLRASQKADRPIYRELPFFYRVRREGRELGSVKGQVDLLFEAPDGKWTLVDYKTTLTQKAEHHRQLAIYAFCLKKLLKGRPHRAALYYSRSGQVIPVDLSALDDAGYESGLINRFEERSAEILG